MGWKDDPVADQASPWEQDQVVNATGTRTEEAMRRAGLQPDASFMDRVRNDLQILGGNAVAVGRGAVKGVTAIASPFADAAGYMINQVAPGSVSQNNVADVDRAMTQMGIPETDTLSEQGIDNFVNFGASMAGGGAASNAIAGRIASRAAPVQTSRGSVTQFNPTAQNAPKGIPRQRTSTPEAQRLASEGIPLDRSQATGGRFSQMLRRAVSGHPFTADRQAAFSREQQRAFNRAVLRSVGADSDKATQGVMRFAKERIGGMFNRVGRSGMRFDDDLSASLDDILNEAPFELSDDAMRPLQRVVESLKSGVKPNGEISGNLVIQTRRRLSNLSDQPDVGNYARQAHEALLDALERSHPEQRQLLSSARDQWRNLKIIERAVSKDAQGNISPSLLANQMFTNQNRAMGVYGQGGDQSLVSLAKAGKNVLPPQLADSGTPSGNIMTAPIRAIATAPLYRAGQSRLLNQRLPAGQGVLRPGSVGAATGAASSVYPRESENESDRSRRR